MTEERYSNIELLRTINVFLIIWIHFTQVIWSVYDESLGIWGVLPSHIIHGISWCAVNTFILISGYFSICPKAKSFFNLYLLCAFYAGILYSIDLYMTGSHMNRWCVYNTLMPFGLWESSSGWWFLPNYLMLYIVSPILNSIIDNISRRRLTQFVILISIVVFYFGWYRNMVWAEEGFNFINFIFLYFIGRYIAIGITTIKSMHILQHWNFWFSLWIVFGGGMGIIHWYANNFIPSMNWMYHIEQYNSPLCIASAICLFMMFRYMSIKSNKVINRFAASSLTIYLVHNSCYSLSKQLYASIGDFYSSHSMGVAYLVMLAISISIMIVIPIIDQVRIAITTPVGNALCEFYYKLKSKIYKYL